MLSRDVITVNGVPLCDAAPAARFGESTELEIACPPVDGARSAELRVGDADLGPPVSTLGDPRWRWRWQPHQAAGVFKAALRVTDAGGSVHSAPFELRITPSKLDAAAYELLLRELERDVAAIVWALGGGRAGAVPEPASSRSLLEEYALLAEHLAHNAAAVCDEIVARPHERLVERPGSVPLAEATRIEPPMLAELARQPLDRVAEGLAPRLQQALRPRGRSGAGLLPRQVRGYRVQRTHDIAEHRMLRRLLATIAWRCEYVAEMLLRELERRGGNEELLGPSVSLRALEERRLRCAAAARGMRRRLELPFFETVGAFDGSAAQSHLQRRDARYRRLGALYRRLRSAPFVAFDCPALWLPVAELPLLYEQWCVLRLVRALLPLGRVRSQRMIERASGGDGRETRWTVRLPGDRPLLELHLDDGTSVALYYQRRYSPGGAGLATLDSYVRIPDAAIELSRGRVTTALIFDAKYRVDPDGRAPQDALDDAYAYRGAIGVGSERATLGAFLLFPGDVPLQTADHVGALPLVPGRPDRLAELVHGLIQA